MFPSGIDWKKRPGAGSLGQLGVRKPTQRSTQGARVGGGGGGGVGNVYAPKAPGIKKSYPPQSAVGLGGAIERRIGKNKIRPTW